MFAGWKVAAGIGVAAAVALGVQEIRLRGQAAELLAAAANVETLRRDVTEAVGANRDLRAEIADIERREAEKAAARDSARAENRALKADIDRLRREARHAPIPQGEENCRPVRGDLRSFALRLLDPGSAEALGGDPGGDAGGAPGPRPPR